MNREWRQDGYAISTDLWTWKPSMTPEELVLGSR